MNDLTVRLALGAAVIGSCALAGRALARVDQRRSKILAETMDGMQLLRIHMLENLMPLEAALEKSNAYIFRETARCMAGGSAREAWYELSMKQTARGGKLDSLASEDCEALDRFFMNLGVTSLEEQRQAFDSAIRELGALENASRSSGAQKNRLYTALGALAGAAAVVGLA